MTKAQFNQLLETINGIKAEVSELRSEVDALKVSTKTSSKSSAKVQTSKKSAKTTATKSSKSITLADFEPKKDSDGNYNYKSWKTCRAKFVASKTGKKDEWIDYAEFCKIAAPFDKKYPYVKKADRC